MGKEIITTPEAIRVAGRNISNLDIKSLETSFPSNLTSSHGLVAEGINEIVDELKIIEGLIEEILKGFPRKLEDVATLIEGYDNASASQFQ